MPSKTIFVYRPIEGTVSIVTSTLFLVLQFWYCWILHKRKLYGFGPKFATTILMFIALFDSLQLIGHFYSGVQLFIDKHLPAYWVFGGLVTSSWNTVSFILCFFVFHRFVYLVFPLYTNKLMHKNVQVGFIVISVLIEACQLTFSCTLWYYDYSTTILHWSVQRDISSFTEVRDFISSAANYLVVVFNLPFYIMIIMALVIRRKRFAKTMNSMDLWIILQMLLFWLYAVFTCYIWEHTVVTNSPFINYLRGTFLGICWNGSKPVSTILAFLLSSFSTTPVSLCQRSVLGPGQMLGGAGVIVEIDESMFYNVLLSAALIKKLCSKLLRGTRPLIQQNVQPFTIVLPQFSATSTAGNDCRCKYSHKKQAFVDDYG